MNRIRAMILAAAAVAFSGVAHAQNFDTAPKAAVRYADLDLSHEAGRAALERRVAVAVKRVCPPTPRPIELQKTAAYEACHRTAWAGARQQLAVIYGGSKLAQASIEVAAATR